MGQPSDSSRSRWIPSVAAVLSIAACYGTLGLISLLGALGIALAVDDALWAGAIVAFAALAVIGLAVGMARHRNPLPLVVGAAGAAVIAYTMYVHYDRSIELAGFAILLVAVLWDWRSNRVLACDTRSGS